MHWLPTQSVSVTALSLPSAHVQTLQRGHALVAGATRTRAIMLPPAAMHKEKHTVHKRYLRAARSTSGRPAYRAAPATLSYKKCVASHQTGATPHALLTVELATRQALKGVELCPPDRPRGPPLSTWAAAALTRWPSGYARQKHHTHTRAHSLPKKSRSACEPASGRPATFADHAKPHRRPHRHSPPRPPPPRPAARASGGAPRPAVARRARPTPPRPAALSRP